MYVKFSCPGYGDHPIVGMTEWPTVPRVDEWVVSGVDKFRVHHVDWIAHPETRGLDYAYVVLRKL